MIFFSNSQETVSGFAEAIEEFQQIFRANEVDFGTPDDFFAFARTLQHDTHLRDALSVVVKSVMETETRISLRTILTIIAVASGGPDVAASDRDMTRPVNLVIDFLLSVGGCSQISPDQPDSPCSDTPDSPAPDTSQTAAATSLTQPPPPTSLSPPPSFDHQLPLETSQDATNVIPFPTSYSDNPDPVVESLTRLELNSLQVKLYLDSIDQRISRMEPRLENVPSLVLPTTPPHIRDADEPKFSATLPSEPPPDQPILSQPPPPPPAATSTRPHLLPRLLTRPQFFSSRRQIALPVFLGFAVLLLAILFYWDFGRTTNHGQAAITSANMQPPTNSQAAPAALRPSAAGVLPLVENTSLSNTPTDPTISPQSAPRTPPAKTSAQIPFTLKPSKLSQPSKPSSAPPPAETIPSDESAEIASEDTPETTSPTYRLNSKPFPDRVNVSSGVMATNLLSSPKPSYPRLAGFTHTQGKVVMQAIISRDGTIENLHVIKGHRLLRGAATSAVRNWRYKPYFVNGRPVEVATIVSVDFNLQP